jgi:hypothetical protein
MGLASAASRSLVSSSSPIADAISNSSSTDFEVSVAVGALDLSFEVGPSNERAAATSFNAVVRDFSDLGAALELRLERDVVLRVLFPIRCVDLGNRCQPVLFLGMLRTFSAACQWLMATKNRVSAIHQSRTMYINHER